MSVNNLFEWRIPLKASDQAFAIPEFDYEELNSLRSDQRRTRNETFLPRTLGKHAYAQLLNPSLSLEASSVYLGKPIGKGFFGQVFEVKGIGDSVLGGEIICKQIGVKGPCFSQVVREQLIEILREEALGLILNPSGELDWDIQEKEPFARTLGLVFKTSRVRDTATSSAGAFTVYGYLFQTMVPGRTMDKLELSNQPISLVSELCRQYVLGILKALDKGVKPEDTHLGNILVRLYPPKISLVDFGLWGKEESFRKATAKFPMTGLNSNFFPLDFLTDLFPLHGLRTELLSVARKNPLLKVQGIMVQRSDYKDFFEKQLAPLFVPSLVNPSFCLKLVHPQLPLAFPPAVLHAIQKAPQIKGIAKSCIHLQICLEGLLSFLCSEGGSESELTKQCEELQQKEKELTQKLYEERFDTPQALDQVDFQKLLPERAHSSTNKHLQLLILRYLWVIWQAGMFGRIVARRVDLDPKREAVRLFAETQQIGDWTASKILRLPNTKEGVEDSKGPWLSSLSSDYLSSKL